MSSIFSGTLVLFLVTWLSFFLFFFNVPYWTGNEMGEVARNGVYRLFYTFCSNIGWVVYKAIERVSNAVDKVLRIRPGSVAHTVINLLFYIGAVYVFSQGYDFLMSSVIGGEVSELKIADESSYSKLSDLLLYWQILNNFTEVHSVGTFFLALKDSFFGIVTFICGTIVFFSAMYGLLVQKTQELCLVEKLSHSGIIKELLEYEEETPSLRTLPKQIVASVVKFFNKLSVLRNFKFFGVQIAFCVILLAYSLVKTILGEQADFQELALDFLDESDIINVLVSFAISFIGAKVAVVMGRLVHRFLPRSVQEKLHTVSVHCNTVVSAIRQKRNEWSLKFDAVYQRTQCAAKWSGTSEDVNKMHLD